MVSLDLLRGFADITRTSHVGSDHPELIVCKRLQTRDLDRPGAGVRELEDRLPPVRLTNEALDGPEGDASVAVEPRVKWSWTERELMVDPGTFRLVGGWGRSDEGK